MSVRAFEEERPVITPERSFASLLGRYIGKRELMVSDMNVYLVFTIFLNLVQFLGCKSAASLAHFQVQLVGDRVLSVH